MLFLRLILGSIESPWRDKVPNSMAYLTCGAIPGVNDSAPTPVGCAWTPRDPRQTAHCVLRTENIFVCWCGVGSDRAAGVGVSLGTLGLVRVDGRPCLGRCSHTTISRLPDRARCSHQKYIYILSRRTTFRILTQMDSRRVRRKRTQRAHTSQDQRSTVDGPELDTATRTPRGGGTGLSVYRF